MLVTLVTGIYSGYYRSSILDYLIEPTLDVLAKEQTRTQLSKVP